MWRFWLWWLRGELWWPFVSSPFLIKTVVFFDFPGCLQTYADDDDDNEGLIFIVGGVFLSYWETLFPAAMLTAIE